MSRLVKTDFLSLLDFFRSYSLASSLDNPEYINHLSQCHKKYYGLMVFFAELFERHPGNKLSSRISSRNIYDRNLYLQEFVSDIGGALFNWSHGAYKASRLLLRSSIENFIKGVGMIDSPAITSTTSVYEVFDLAGASPPFQPLIQKKAFRRLRGHYSTLCADAHGGSINHMQHTKSLNYFPGFDARKSGAAAKIFCDISQDILGVAAVYWPDVLLNMHYLNIDVVNPLLSKAIRRNLSKID